MKKKTVENLTSELLNIQRNVADCTIQTKLAQFSQIFISLQQKKKRKKKRMFNSLRLYVKQPDKIFKINTRNV